MTITNATVYDLPESLPDDPDAGRVANNVTLTQKSMPLSAKLSQTQLVMHLPEGMGGIGPYNATDIAWFTMTQQTIDHGTNIFQFDSQLNVLDPVVFVNFAFGMLFDITPYVPVYIVGSPKLTAMGFIQMDLKLGKQLNCSYVPPDQAVVENWKEMQESDDSLQESEEATTARRLQGLPPITMSCKQTGDLTGDEINSILDHFDEELQRTTTTTTTTTPAPTTPAPATTTTTAATRMV